MRNFIHISHINILKNYTCNISLIGLCLSPFVLLQQSTTDWVTYKQQILFLIILEPGSPRSGCYHGKVRALSGVTDFSLCPHMSEGTRDLPGVSFIRALIPFLISEWKYASTSQKPHLLTPSHWALGFHHMNLEGIQTFRLKQAP